MVPVPSWKALAKRFQRSWFPVPKSNGSLSRTSMVPVPRSPRRAGFPVQIGSPSRTKSVPCPVLVPLSRYGSRCLQTKPAGARLKTLGRMAEMPLSGTAFTRREAILPTGAKHASVVHWTYESASNEPFACLSAGMPSTEPSGSSAAVVAARTPAPPAPW